MRLACLLVLISFSLCLACTPRATLAPSPSPTLPVPTPTVTTQPRPTDRVTAKPTSAPEMPCEAWQSWPVVPLIPSQRTRELYQRGQLNRNNPRAFSKIGDGEISAEWFFTVFDLGEPHYDLGRYQNLQDVIEQFEGSYGRIGLAARRGFNTEKILDPSLSDSSVCELDESPLACELHLHRPAFAILSLGTNQVWKPDEFEAGMRQILDILLSQNVVPILSTKGDNLEGDHRINRTIACLAAEYEVPLWNFWAAIQPLPNHGLQPDLEHLTYGITDFDDTAAMKSAWTIRNLTALQTLDAVWRSVTVQP